MSGLPSDNKVAEVPSRASGSVGLLQTIALALTRRGYEWTAAPIPQAKAGLGDFVEPQKTSETSPEIQRWTYLGPVTASSPFYPQVYRDQRALSCVLTGGDVRAMALEILETTEQLLDYVGQSDSVLYLTDVRCLRGVLSALDAQPQRRDRLVASLSWKDKISLFAELGPVGPFTSRALCSMVDNSHAWHVLAGWRLLEEAPEEWKAGVAAMSELHQALGDKPELARRIRVDWSDVYGTRTLEGLSFYAGPSEGPAPDPQTCRGGQFVMNGQSAMGVTIFLDHVFHDERPKAITAPMTCEDEPIALMQAKNLVRAQGWVVVELSPEDHPQGLLDFFDLQGTLVREGHQWVVKPLVFSN